MAEAVVPPPRVDRLAGRPYRDGPPAGHRPDRAPLDPLAAGETGDRDPGDLRPGRARGRGDRRRRASLPSAAAPPSHGRARPPRRRGLGRGERRHAELAGPPASDERHVVSAREGHQLLTWPKPGGQLGPSAAVRLRFSEPVSALLHGRMPSFSRPWPGAGGSRRHTIEFAPRGYGFGIDTPVRLKLPLPVRPAPAGKATRTIAWPTPAGSELRLEELLALLGYLPLRWTATKEDADGRSRARSGRRSTARPAGSSGATRTRRPRSSISGTRASTTMIVRGAVMAFQNEHGLTVDGFAGGTSGRR